MEADDALFKSASAGSVFCACLLDLGLFYIIVAQLIIWYNRGRKELRGDG